MQVNSHIFSTVFNLIESINELSAGCDPDFDTAYEELERQYAELRLTFGNDA
jgi:hypothetical protein